MLTEVPLSGRSARQPSDRVVWALFVVTSFLGSGLLFAVEPMVARLLLPRLGGAPSVWTTALVFFQAALLAGYGLAHVLCRRLRLERHVMVQVALLIAAGATLPVAIPEGWLPPLGGSPVWWTLGALVVAVGAPFVVLSSASPTLQRWLAQTDHRSAHDPYFLYAAGNAGSLIALLAYPFLLEPAIGLEAQTRLWSVAYAGLIVLTGACAVVARLRAAPDSGAIGASAASSVRIPYARRDLARWVGLASIPSALLVGVTRHISTDVAAIPLLWVIPLSLYLLSFVLAFGANSDKVASIGAWAALIAIVPVLWAIGFWENAFLWEIGVHLLGFAAVACAVHGRLAALRPHADDLSGYYVALSLGGVLGGTAAAIIAPLIFDRVFEYPIALAAVLLAVPARRALPAPSTLARFAALLPVLAVLFAFGGTLVVLARLVVAGTLGALVFRRLPRTSFAVLLALTLWQVQYGEPKVIYADRTFFGTLNVKADGPFHVLESGTTVHGIQDQRSGVGRYEPISYYTRLGPVGQIYTVLGKDGPLDVGVVGLGAGTMAAYSRPEVADRFTFYEIDEGMIRVAEDPELFSFLSEIDVDVQLGDGRVLLERAESTRHDLLVIDAFASDAIPMHLLTREAFQIYASRLADGGVLAVHLSNRFFDLVPQVITLGASAGLDSVAAHYPTGGLDGDDPQAYESDWVVLSADPQRLAEIPTRGFWGAPPPADEVWTDDHADLLSTLRW